MATLSLHNIIGELNICIVPDPAGIIIIIICVVGLKESSCITAGFAKQLQEVSILTDVFVPKHKCDRDKDKRGFMILVHRKRFLPCVGSWSAPVITLSLSLTLFNPLIDAPPNQISPERWMIISPSVWPVTLHIFPSFLVLISVLFDVYVWQKESKRSCGVSISPPKKGFAVSSETINHWKWQPHTSRLVFVRFSMMRLSKSLVFCHGTMLQLSIASSIWA